MKCKFEHDGTCCNSGTFQFKDTCDSENCNYCAPMSHGDAFRTSSDKELARFFFFGSKCYGLSKTSVGFERSWPFISRCLVEMVAGAL